MKVYEKKLEYFSEFFYVKELIFRYFEKNLIFRKE